MAIRKIFTVNNGAELRDLGNSEPTWLRMAQGLLLSLPSLYGDRTTIGYLRVGELYELYFESWGKGVTLCLSHSVLSRLVFWLTNRLGRTQPHSPLELRRRPGYVLVLNLVSFENFEFSLDLSSFDITESLS